MQNVTTLLIIILCQIAFPQYLPIYSNTIDTIQTKPAPEKRPTATTILSCGHLPGATQLWDSNPGSGYVQVKQNFRIVCLTDYLWFTFQIDDDLWVRFNYSGGWIFSSGFNCGSTVKLYDKFPCNQTLTIYARGQDRHGTWGNQGLSYILSSPTCPVCNSTSFFKTDECKCIPCTYYGVGCHTCSQPAKCLSCVNNTYTLVSGLCPTCLSLLAGCLTCSSQSTCLTCNSSNYFRLTGNNCSCYIGYVLNGSDCVLCSLFMPNCLACSSPSICLRCQVGYALSPLTCKFVVYPRLPYRMVMYIGGGMFGMVVMVIMVMYFKVRKGGRGLERVYPHAEASVEGFRKVPSVVNGNCNKCGHSRPDLLLGCQHLYHWDCILQKAEAGEWLCIQSSCRRKQPYAAFSCDGCYKYFNQLRFPYKLKACACLVEKNHEQCIINQIRQVRRSKCPFSKQKSS